MDVPLPKRCSHCGGPVEFQRTAQQFQEEIVRRTLVRRFHIAIGHCRDCQRQVQGRHELQTSDAVRPFVIARKVWGGNRTCQGARTQQILGSILRTCLQQRQDPFPRIVALLRSPTPLTLDIARTSRSP